MAAINPPVKYHCPSCDLTFTKRTLDSHGGVCMNCDQLRANRKECVKCNAVFDCLDNDNVCTFCKEVDEPVQFTCPACKKVYSSLEDCINKSGDCIPIILTQLQKERDAYKEALIQTACVAQRLKNNQ
jgi:hypothetical protein